MVKVSIVIVTYNSSKYIDNLLKSILSSDYEDYEVIVVDNNSSDRTLEVLENYRKHMRRLRIIRLRKNVGFPKACNIGATASKGEYLFFLNPDTIVSNNTISELAGILDNNPMVGVVQPKILLGDRLHIDSLGGYMDVLGHGYHKGRGLHVYVDMSNELIEIFYATFAAAMVRRKLYYQLGGLRNEYFLYNEDLDFCWRVWLRGYRVVYDPNTYVIHFGMHSTRRVNQVVLFNSRKNRLVNVFTNYSNPLLAITSTITLMLLYFLAIVLSAAADGKVDLTFIKSLTWFISKLRLIAYRRSRIVRVISDKELFQRKLIDLKLIGVREYIGSRRIH